MQGIVFLTGADRGLGLGLAEGLAQKGWRVFAGQFMPGWPELGELAARYPENLTLVPLDVSSEESVRAAAQRVRDAAGQVDVLINNAGVTSPSMHRPIQETQDYAEMHRLYDVNTLGALRVVNTFLPLVERGAMKRLCFVSSEAGSVGEAQRTSWFGYCMSKAALNMAVKILFNDLRPRGFTFRLYHPGWVRSYMSGKKNLEATLEPEEAAVPALAYFLGSGQVEMMGNPVEIDEDDLVLREYTGRVWSW